MSKTKTFLIAGSLIGASVLLIGALGGAHAFGNRQMGWGPMGHGFGGYGHGMGMMRGGHRMRAMIRRADVNGDGVITRQEATAQRQRRFDRFDLDKNGEVTTNEAINALIKRFEGRIKRKIRSFDENGDGKVSRAEFNAPILERFANHDANGDGRLTKDEIPWILGDRGGRGSWFGRHYGPQAGHMGPGRGMRPMGQMGRGMNMHGPQAGYQGQPQAAPQARMQVGPQGRFQGVPQGTPQGRPMGQGMMVQPR